MLIKCPECSKEVSDKAEACPNCAYPIAKKVEANEVNEPKKSKKKENNKVVAEAEVEEIDPVNKPAGLFMILILQGFITISVFILYFIFTHARTTEAGAIITTIILLITTSPLLIVRHKVESLFTVIISYASHLFIVFFASYDILSKYY